MLKDFKLPKRPSKEEVKERLKKAGEELFSLQMEIKNHKVPVCVLIEGWGAAGKGSVIGKIIKNIDPRFFKVAAVSAPDREERRKPFLHRYFVQIPEEGRFTFFDGGWMEETVKEREEGKLDKKDYKLRIESIQRFERQLTDNGYLLVKYFFQITEKEQEKRLNKLLEEKDTKWRVSDYDKWQNENYEKCSGFFDRFLKDTNTSSAPWYLVDAQNKDWAQLQVMETLIVQIWVALQNHSLAVPILQNPFELKKMPLLNEIPLQGKEIPEENYKKELKKLQKELGELHNRLYRKKVPVVIVYEGWDAAGKGGNIKRITEALDPRGYEVHPIASPQPYEKARHYLWRFWMRLPKTGHIAIFDRSWYGRVMVERLEGFCSENDWKRAYNEINEFEKELSDWGAVLLKFWVQIDKDTQLERFTLREHTPEKKWKITEEDWRNREKWDAYEEAVNEMIQKTSTACAPWYILESVDKKYARIKALKIVIKTLKKVLKD